MQWSFGAVLAFRIGFAVADDLGAVMSIRMKTAPLLCLDVTGGSTDDGTKIEIWECNGSENQLWYFPEGWYQIRYAGDPNKCIDAGDGQGGSQLMLWTCNGLDQQKWGFDPDAGSIYLAGSQADASICMDLAGGQTDGGTPVQNWACNGLWGQQWALSYGITIRASWNYRLCLDLAGGDTDNGKTAWMWDCNGSPNQQWYFTDGDFHIRFAGDPNKCLDAGNMQGGVNTQVWDCNNEDQQIWGYDWDMGSVFLAKSKSDASVCLDMAGGGTEAGTAVDVWDCNGCWNQAFTIIGPAPQTAAWRRIVGNQSFTVATPSNAAAASQRRVGMNVSQPQVSCPDKPGPAPGPGPGPPDPSGENPLNIQPNGKRSDNFFFILGDWGAPQGKSYGCQRKIAGMMSSYKSNQEQQGKKLLFVGAVGDNFYYTGLSPNHRDEQFEKQWKNIYGDLINVPWLGVLGNHDHGSADPGCACGKGCTQFNSGGRPDWAWNFWIPDYYWYYLIPAVGLEIIGLDTNAEDVKGLGGGGCDGGAKKTCDKCGGAGNIQNFLNQKKSEGEGLLDQRAGASPATTVLIMQHYPGSTPRAYKSRFEQNNGGKAKVLSAYGHTHDQLCQGSRDHGCDVIMTGGGGGYIDNGKYLGFTAVHLTDDGGYQTVMETGETRFHANECKWFLEFTDVDNATMFI